MKWATSAHEMKTKAARRNKLYAAHVRFGFAMLTMLVGNICASVPAHQRLKQNQYCKSGLD